MVRGILRRSVLAIGVVAGLAVSMAQPAWAEETGWKVISPDGHWTCSGRLSSPSSIADVRACIVVNGNYAQAVLSVRNVTDNRIIATAVPGVYLYEDGSERVVNDCIGQELYPDWRRGCLGETVHSSCGRYVQAKVQVAVRTVGGRNSTAGGFSPTVRYCSS